jgi:hypothetical protein
MNHIFEDRSLTCRPCIPRKPKVSSASRGDFSPSSLKYWETTGIKFLKHRGDHVTNFRFLFSTFAGNPQEGPLSSNDPAANGVDKRPLRESSMGRPAMTKSESSKEGENRDRVSSGAALGEGQKNSEATSGGHAVVSTYICDFGNVVKGSQKKKTIRVHNSNPTLASFALLNKSALLALGFNVEPDSVPKLAEGEGADITLTLQTNKPNGPVGPIECRAEVEVKGGPQVVILMRADVMVPEVQLSTDVINFGAVQTGRCRVMTVQLFNPNGVPAEWAVKKHPDAANSRDWGYFACEPALGTLQPGERTNMEVKFTPGTEQEKYGIKFPIKVTANPRQPMVTCKGLGFGLKVVAAPSLLDLGAVLPGAPLPREKRFMLQNPSAVPIEVYSLDLDRQYLEEEEALRAAGGFEGLEVLTLPPREPGAPFWSPELLAGGGMAPGEKSDQLGDGKLWVVVNGPPALCGTHAGRLSEEYGVPIIDVDATVSGWRESERERSGGQEPQEVGVEGAVENGGGVLSEEELGRALVDRFSWDDCSKGLIVNGLSSQHVPVAKIARLVLQSLGLRQEAVEAASLDTEAGAPVELGAKAEPGVKWVGDKLVTVLLLRDSQEEAAEAEKRRQVADLEVAEAMKQAEQQKEAPTPKGGKGRPNSSNSKKGSGKQKPEGKSSSRRTSAVQGASESAAPPVKPKTPLQELLEALGSDGATSSSHVPVQTVDVSGKSEDQVLVDLCAPLPDVRSPEERAKEVPPPKEFQLLRRPGGRMSRSLVPQFTLLTVSKAETEVSVQEAGQSESSIQSATEGAEAGGSISQGEKSRSASPSSWGESTVERTRWVIPPNGEVELLVRFSSTEVGRFETLLGFEVLGAGQSSVSSVVCRAVCARPQISADPRNVFYRKAKGRPSTAQLRKQYVVSSGRFEFGPLLAGKSKEGYQQGKHPENRERFRISNNGLFDLRVTFAFKVKGQVSGRSTPEASSGAAADAGPWVGRGASKSVDVTPKDLKRIASAKISTRSKKEGQSLNLVKEDGAMESTDEVFIVEPNVLQLKADETQEIVVYAFPTQVWEPTAFART